MAITHPVHPVPSDGDLVSLEAAVSLLRRTPHPVSKPTLTRWIARHGVARRRIGRVVHVSFSDVLEVHRDEIARRLAEESG